MYFPSLTLTDAGRSIIIKAMNGGSIQFTKVMLGNGEAPDNIKAAVELTNRVADVPITEITQGDGCVMLDAAHSNVELEAGFYAREIGIFANDEDLGEVMYAYANAGTDAAYIPAFSDATTVKTTFRFVVAVGDAENVTAVISEYIGMVTKEEFKSHTENKRNPHGVTAADVGLGNVPNVAPQNMQPTFGLNDIDTVQNFASGEKLGTILQKIHNAIEKLITHLKADNPHSITLAKLKAAAEKHNHAASDINSGVLGVQRGGTGCTSLADLATSLAGQMGSAAFGGTVAGYYVGNGQSYRFIELGFTPSAVLVWGDSGVDDYYIGLAVKGRNACIQTGYETAKVNSSNYHYIRVAIDTDGFYVTQCSSHARTNANGVSYKYLAFK